MTEMELAAGMNDDGGKYPPPATKYLTPDPFLQYLVSIANSGMLGETGHEHTIGITLHVHGLIVSGQLISLRAFFLHLGDLIRGADIEPAMESADKLGVVAHAFEDFGQQSFEGASDVDKATPCYVHLREARVYPSLPALPGNYMATGQVWRGRLSEVDGFHLGTTIYATT